MSKIGKINIPIPEKVKVLLTGNTVNVEGPLGKQAIKLDLEMFELKIKFSFISIVSEVFEHI